MHKTHPLALAGVLASLAAFPSLADAALTVQPNAPALGFPASVTDAVGDVALTSCQDTSGFCIETPAPNQAAPLAVPGNYTADGEAFYSLADATVPNAGTGLARFALEQAFTGADPVAGQQVLFGRVRFRFQDLTPGASYRVTHPYGISTFVADADGIINETDDQGCIGPPCDFQATTYGQITSFLRWDPTIGAPAPVGYVGNPSVPHAVIGSPLGTNFVRLERLGGALPVLIGQTDQFLVQGKLAGAAPAPAPFAVLDANAMTFGSRQVGTTTPPRNVTLTNHGTAPLNVSAATIGGADGGDFAVGTSTCNGPVAPGASCSIGVTFAPRATGDRSATLTVASDSLGAPHTVALSGIGTPAATPAPAPIVLQGPIVIHSLTVPAARVARRFSFGLQVARRVRLRRARAGGIAVTFTAPTSARLVRLRLMKAGSRKSVATKLVRITVPGRQTVHLRVRGTRAGRYTLELATGRSASTLTRGATAALTLSR